MPVFTFLTILLLTESFIHNSHPHCLEGEMHPKDKNDSTWIVDHNSSLLTTFKIHNGHGEQFRVSYTHSGRP